MTVITIDFFLFSTITCLDQSMTFIYIKDYPHYIHSFVTIHVHCWIHVYFKAIKAITEPIHSLIFNRYFK
jgi:hypothetical protein